MEEELTDPHEQQLYDVFKSCLKEGQSKLNQNGLLELCCKLELDESHRKAMSELLNIQAIQKLISFHEFRDAFVTLLDKSRQTTVNGLEKEINAESKSLSKNNTMCTKYNHQPKEKTQTMTTNYRKLQNEKIFNHQILQETWTNQNTFTIEDVNTFCNRDFSLPKQVIENIFEKLDIDCDGLISLDEFLNFFQIANNKLQEESNVSWSTQLQSDCMKSADSFVHHQNRNISRSAIIELWEVAGVSEANSLLLELGFDTPTINFIDLSNALSSELKLHRVVSDTGDTGEYVRLLKGTLTLYQEEVRNLNSSMEQLRCERDKLRSDMSEANERANLFAQEMDEQQARMDKGREEALRQLEARHAEVLKCLAEQQQLERERNATTTRSLEDQLSSSQLEEQRLRAELAHVLRELKSLEAESQGQNEAISKLEASNAQLTAQLCELAAARQQVDSIETKENERVAELLDHIKRLQTEIKILRDHNDELTSELEMLKHRDNDAKSVVSSVDIRSTISDENDGLASITSDTEDEEKQQQLQQSRYSDYSKVSSGGSVGGSSSSKIANCTTSTRSNKAALDVAGASVNKLNEIIQEFRNFLTGAKFCVDCSILRNEVSSLISELELYQSSMSTVPASTTNKRRKHLKNLANELEDENSIYVSETLGNSVVSKSETVKNGKKILNSKEMMQEDLDSNFHDSDMNSAKNEFSDTTDFSRQHNNTVNDVCSEKIVNNTTENSDNINEKVPLKEEELKNTSEKQLIDRCNELEKSLEMLKSEYEQCEDYWAAKLDEERLLFEQEQKVSDEKFSELLVKMAEYEEQFSSEKRDGRLSPIEERAMLEQQYTALEEEFERWKLEAQEDLIKKDTEIKELKSKLSSEKQLSLIDNAVQFPDEQMKNMYPNLYSALLCTPEANSTKNENLATAKDEATIVSAEQKTESTPPCSQCHKTKKNCDCHITDQRQSEQHSKDQKSRRSEGKNRYRMHHQRRTDVDHEFVNLIKQKEKLRQEIMRLQSIKAMSANHIYPFISPAEHNVVANLYAKLYAHEQRQKYLQFCLNNQQKESERIIQKMWKQHIVETTDLRHAIKTTEDKLKQQIKLNNEQAERLTKMDFLTKELYVENGKLSETIKRLEQHCQILTQNRIESST